MTTPLHILSDSFGHKAFRPGQEEIVDHILAGKNVLAVMPTGAGKSICYQVPSQLLERPTIVISPLVALMDNQAAGLRANGVAVAAIHSGQSREENVTEWKRIAQGNAKLLYLSPERLMQLRMLSAMQVEMGTSVSARICRFKSPQRLVPELPYSGLHRDSG